MKLNVTHPTVEEVFNDFYAIPAFQREYVWQDEQVRTLLEDAFDALFDENGSPVDTEYFIGSIVAYKENDVLQLIDGQQRITTLYIALCGIRDVLGTLAGDDDLSHLNKLIRATYQDDDGKTQERLRLMPLYQDAGEALQFIAARQVGQLERRKLPVSARNMLEAYDVVVEFLERFSGKAERIRQFQARLTKRVRLVKIETANVSEALRIFETINDRGIGLNAMDLLKNLLFMRASKDKYDALNKDWQEMVRTVQERKGGAGEKPLRFLRYFVLSQWPHARKSSKPLTEDDLYEWIDVNQRQIGILDNPTGFARKLLEAARDYRDFVLQPNPSLENIVRLSGRARQHLIIMLASKRLGVVQVAMLSHRLEALFVAFVLAKEPTKALDAIFSNAAPKLREVNPDDQVAFEAFMETSLEPEIRKRSAAAMTALAGLGLERKTAVRFVLARLSQFVEHMATGIPRGIQQYWDHQIEHILPNTPTQAIMEAFDQPERYHEFKQKLGNLVLLEKPVNIKVGQDFLSDKKVEYVKSSLFMTRSVVAPQAVGNTSFTRAAAKLRSYPNDDYPCWSAGAITARQLELTALAGTVFGYLES
ncbi:DUF262 domain-containing protein [Luteimonas sp. WGS1318]|uniref:DUF262 domain-containing protein n=1 Tax=Luteimonas sp. WGS1318 TaxID=3366815 RepID=UPI00372D5499